MKKIHEKIKDFTELKSMRTNARLSVAGRGTRSRARNWVLV